MMKDIHEIKTANPIEAVIQAYGVTLKKKGNRFTGICPFHEDRTPSFTVYPETGTFKCFGCDLQGDVIDFVGYLLYSTAWNNHDPEMFKEALKKLGSADRAVPFTPRPIQSREERSIELGEFHYAALGTAARLYHENLLSLGTGEGTPIYYLRSRGLSTQTIREYQLGYCPKDGAGLMAAVHLMNLPLEYFIEAGLIMRAQKTGRLFELFWGRITIPDRNLSRQTIYMVARQFPPDHPKSDGQFKYLSLNGLTPPLIGWGRLDRRKSNKPVFLVEAPMCYLTLTQWGYDALARNGTGMPEADAERLRRLAADRTLVIIPQNDKPGVIAAARWKDAIGLGPKAVRIMWLPELKGETVKDVNDLAQVEDGQRVFEGLVKQRMQSAREHSPPGLDELGK